MKKVLEIFMFNNHFLFIGFLAFSVFSCTTSSYMAHVENEDEFEKSDFKFTVIDTWTTYNRNCKIGDYFIDFTTDRNYDKKWLNCDNTWDKLFKKQHVDFSWHENKKHGGILLKNNELVYEIYMVFDESGVSRRANYTTFGNTVDKVKGTRKLYFLIGKEPSEIVVDTRKQIVLEDNSVIPISVEKVDAVRCDTYDGERIIESSLFDSYWEHGSGEIVKIRGEEYALLDLAMCGRNILFKKNFSQELSESEKDYVVSIIILLCELRDYYEEYHATETVIDYEVLTSEK